MTVYKLWVSWVDTLLDSAASWFLSINNDFGKETKLQSGI